MPINDLPDDLLRLAQRIADGEDLDWSKIGEGEAGDRGRVVQLEAIDRIRRGHSDFLRSDLPMESWGPLDLKEHLASGGFGQVFLAHDRNLDRQVALKLLREDDNRSVRTNFVEEARRLAKVDHPNVVRVHGVDRFEGRLGIWMERIEGETLEQRIRGQGTFGAQESAVVGVDLCRALAAIHAAGLIHGDVKLSNVMRAVGGRVVLMDFGSSSRPGGRQQPALTGTQAYLAPEVIEGRPPDEKADLFALGVLLYRLAGGDYPRPFADELRSASAGPAPIRPLLDLNPDLPAGFVQIVERALSADPNARFASAGEFERALSGFLGPARESATPAPAAVPGRDGLSRVGWAVAAAAVLVAVVAISSGRAWLAPFEPEAEFFRMNGARDQERLLAGARTQLGDELFVELRNEQPSWTYVVNADALGEENLLFPIPGLELENPIPAGTHRIPGRIGEGERYWKVSSSGRRETLLVIASRKPVEFLERRIATLPPGALGVPIRLAEAGVAAPKGGVADRMRGIAELSAPAESDPAQENSISEIRRQVLLESGEGRGVRIWELTLVNTGVAP